MHDRPPPLGCANARSPRLGAILLASAILLLVAIGPARAQLGVGDLQKAHALTANSAGWVGLRGALRTVIEAAGIATGDDPEELADTLAVILALEDGGGRLDAVLIGAVRAAMTAHDANDPEIDRRFSDQGLTLARARAISCLVFGRDPEGRAGIAEALGLGKEEARNCPLAYAGFRDHWLDVARPIRAAAVGAPGQPASVELSPAGGVKASARAILIAGQTVHEVGSFVTSALASPVPITLRGMDCADAGEPAAGEVRVCYGLVADFAGGIERGLVAGHPPGGSVAPDAGDAKP